MKYEMVAGLETHVELSTDTKIFCGCSTGFGAKPNTHCCPVCIGLPGTLPVLNRQAVRFAVMAGLATHCEISRFSKMDRKNYVYPDLSKAYQISQFDRPLCEHGYIELHDGRKMRIHRIHIEEDAGKLTHQGGDTLVDYNRAGVPLIEIVTEPDFRSAEDIREYLEKLQRLMRYIGVSDCKMQEGSLRCDVNISVRPAGSDTLGTRTEIKNMNSFTFIDKAVHYEVERQIDVIESGEAVVQETRRYDDVNDVTESMRGKEDANDYRYFREPDLVTIALTEEEIEECRRALPETPEDKFARYTQDWGLPESDAELLVRYRPVAAYFEEAAAGVTPKTVANFILGQVFRRVPTEAQREEGAMPIPASYLRDLAKLTDSGKCQMSMAKKALETMLDTGKPVSEVLTEEDMAGMDDGALRALCEEVMRENPAAVSDIRAGKQKAMGALVGGVMRRAKGKADAAAATKIFLELIGE